jgi:hypothetical protein
MRKVAAERGWGMLTFTRPVALRTALTPPTPVLAGLGAAAALLVLWWLWKRLKAR